MTAIFKSGSKSRSENYRPISLTSVPGKNHGKTNSRRNCQPYETKPVILTQHGFLEGRSCTTQLLEFLEDITAALDQGDVVDVIYLDFCKAFDKDPINDYLRNYGDTESGEMFTRG